MNRRVYWAAHALTFGFLVMAIAILSFTPVTESVQAQSSDLQVEAKQPRPRYIRAQKTERSTPLEGRYLVGLVDSVAADSVESVAKKLVRQYGGRLESVMKDAVKAFVVSGMDETAAYLLSNEAQVEVVEQDAYVKILDSNNFPSYPRLAEVEAAQNPFALNLVRVTQAPWFLDRLDAKPLTFDGISTWDNNAPNVHMYIIDTGFDSRLRSLNVAEQVNFVTDGRPLNHTCNQHANWVAAIAGGEWGQARSAKLVSVRVLDCAQNATAGSNYTWIVQGLDYVRGQANTKRPAVAVTSWVYPAGTNIGGALIRTAVESLLAAGVTVVAASDQNNLSNTPGVSNETKLPCSIPGVICVGGSTYDSVDRKWPACARGYITLFAPAQYMISNSIYQTGETFTQNGLAGNSLAAPLVASVAAGYLEKSRNALPAQVRKALVRKANSGRLQGLEQGDPNLLLYSGVSTTSITSSASYRSTIAPDSLATAFTDNLSTFNSLSVEDAAGIYRPAIIASRSALQVNFVVPSEVARISTQANIDISGFFGCGLFTPCLSDAMGTVNVYRIAPSLFSANASGSGIVNGQLLRINRQTGSAVYEQLAVNGNTLTPTTEIYWLILYGTGFRYRNNLTDVRVNIAGRQLPLNYAGLVGGVHGLDQMNVQIPDDFTSRGVLDIIWSVEGITGNTVKVYLKAPTT